MLSATEESAPFFLDGKRHFTKSAPLDQTLPMYGDCRTPPATSPGDHRLVTDATDPQCGGVSARSSAGHFGRIIHAKNTVAQFRARTQN
jgi:hypothetical protein